MGLDTVEILMAWEESFGISISDDEAAVIRTPRMAIDLIAAKLPFCNAAQRPCLTMRAFHRLRSSIIEIAGARRDQIRPDASCRQIGDPSTWRRIRAHSEISSLPGLGWFSSRTIGKLARWTAAHAARELKSPGEAWTRSEIRSVVRAITAEAVGYDSFSDDDHFVEVMGLD